MSAAGCAAKNNERLVDKIAISLCDTSRSFTFTNKNYGQYYGRTNEYYDNTFQGWTFRERRIFSDYQLLVNGKPIARNRAAVSVYPYKLIRSYTSGLKEELFFADNLDLLVLKFDGLPDGKVTLRLSNILPGSSEYTDGIISYSFSETLQDYKLFVDSDGGISANGAAGERSLDIRLKNTSSALITLYISKDQQARGTYASSYQELKENKAERLEKLLSESYVSTNNAEFDKALMWAKISLDALITTQDMKGIFAGLPWFNSYWGRDTFLSLPGAALVTGNYKDARDILLSFAAHQDKDTESQYYGRIPNRVTLSDRIYNTADATPLFVSQCFSYIQYTNDMDFLRSIYDVVKTAYTAAVEKNTDGQGFLVHKDAETWMDAVGPGGPWSPRGNRAADIQALWYRQLLCTSEMAGMMNDTILSRKAARSAEKVRSGFMNSFVDKERSLIYDHIRADGSKDSRLRPNVFFALNQAELFSSSIERLKILGNVTDKLVMPYGVLSLAYDDELFHPYHQMGQMYHKDEAYHNGTIWQWLSGPVIQALCSFGKQDLAWQLTEDLTGQILHRGSAGTLAECMDAIPEDGKTQPRLSGAVSQAWSLAEYIRNFYQDYLGIRPDAHANALYLLPALPEKITRADVSQKIGPHIVKIRYTMDDKIYRVEIDASGVRDSLDVGIALINKADANYQMKTVVKNGDKLIVQIPAYSNELKNLIAMRNGERIRISSQIYNEPPANSALYDKVKIADVSKVLPFLGTHNRLLKRQRQEQPGR